MDNPAPVGVPIHELMRGRWSSLAYNPARPVSRDDLRAILEAARWAPSSFNEQPWRYLVFDGSDPDVRERARACLVEGNAWARTAPLLLLSVARETFTRNDKPNRHAQHDVGLASENLVLQASALGLVAHQMAGFDAEGARREFRIPDGYAPMVMIAIGHPGRVEDLPEALQERDRAPRQRRSLGEWAFAGTWEHPVDAG